MGKFLILVGPSGCGKTAVSDELKKRDDFIKVTTCTTRDPRPGEVNGLHYHFLTEDEFKVAVVNGEFAETFPYANHFYGTRYKELNEVVTLDKNVVFILEINGAQAIKKVFPDNTIVVFLERELEVLEAAVTEREVSDEDKETRKAQMKNELKLRNHPCIDYVIYNENGKLNETVERIVSLL